MQANNKQQDAGSCVNGKSFTKAKTHGMDLDGKCEGRRVEARVFERLTMVIVLSNANSRISKIIFDKFGNEVNEFAQNVKFTSKVKNLLSSFNSTKKKYLIPNFGAAVNQTTTPS